MPEPNTFTAIASAGQFIRAGKLKALGITSTARVAAMPDVPTFIEAGLPGFVVNSWIGIFAPSATPAGTVKKLTEDFQAALGHAEVTKKLTDAGFEVMASDGPALDRYAREQHDRWGDFVKRTGLKMEE